MRGLVAAVFVLAAVFSFAPSVPACQSGKQSCNIFNPCCSGLTCDVLLECRHTPGLEGERCGAGVPCASGLVCSASVAGRCEACRTGGQSCGITGGGGTCCSGLVCDAIGECRHSPSLAGEPCGLGVPCAEGLGCSATVGGRCELCKSAGQSCGVLGGGGECCASDGLVCDFIGECRHEVPQLGEPCGIGVPCASPYICPLAGGRCVHSPAEEGELCDLDGIGGAQCGPDLTCQAGIPQVCVRKKTIGQACFSEFNCEKGLECLPLLQKCYPADEKQLFDKQECLDLYRANVHQTAKDSNTVYTFGYGSAAAAGLSRTYELGNAYGPDGSYGCYLTTCSGITGDAEIGAFAASGFYNSYDVLSGRSFAIVEEAGDGVTFSTSQIFTLGDPPVLIGTEDALNVELSLAPIAAGEYFCNTTLRTVIPDTDATCGNGIVETGEACDDGDTVFHQGDACTAECLAVPCGEPSGRVAVSPSASDALITLRAAVGSVSCAASVCDVDQSGSIGAADALLILKAAVGTAALDCGAS